RVITGEGLYCSLCRNVLQESFIWVGSGERRVDSALMLVEEMPVLNRGLQAPVAEQVESGRANDRLWRLTGRLSGGADPSQFDPNRSFDVLRSVEMFRPLSRPGSGLWSTASPIRWCPAPPVSWATMSTRSSTRVMTSW